MAEGFLITLFNSMPKKKMLAVRKIHSSDTFNVIKHLISKHLEYGQLQSVASFRFRRAKRKVKCDASIISEMKNDRRTVWKKPELFVQTNSMLIANSNH